MASSYSPKIATNNLVLAWDAANPKSYPGSGTTVYDLSGNGNNFTLINGTSYNAGGYFQTDGVNDYIKSASTVNLSGYDYVVVDLWMKSLNDATYCQAFEHSNNWNTNTGGFGLFIHNNGSGYVKNMNHTNHNGSAARNYAFTMDQNWCNHINLYSKVSDSTGRLVWTNGNLTAFSNNNGYPTGTSTGAASFRNDTIYMGARGGTSAFGQGGYGSFKIYGFKFSDANSEQNFNALRSRYGI